MSQWTYENSNTSSFLVYSINENEQLDTVALGMITNNAISGVLPMFFMQNNNDRFIKYNITSKVSLKMFFEGKITRNRFLSTVVSICSTLIQCDDYMLEQQSFLLDEEYIFVDVSTGKTFLACVPVLNQHITTDFKQFFKNILFSSQFDQSENGDYIAKTLNFLNTNQSCTLLEMSNFANQLLKGNQDSAQVASAVVYQQPKPSVNMEESAIQNESVEQIQPKSMQGTLPNTPPPVSIPQAKATPAPQIPPAPDKQVKSGFAFFNRGKKKEKGVPAPARNIRIPGADSSVPASNMPIPSSPSAVGETMNQPISNNVQNVAPVTSPATPAVNMQFEVMANKNVVASNDTVELNQSMIGGDTTPKLYREKTKQLIALDKAVFKIGKEPNYVDYCISDNSAISRCHANILKRGEDYFIVDSNSTNHTYINGKMLQGNEEIKLEQGYKVRLANEEFEFRFY